MTEPREDVVDSLQALTDALDVATSPDFEARVRERVDADRVARRRTWRYSVAVAVPAVAALLIIVFATRERTEESRPALSHRVEATSHAADGGASPEGVVVEAAATAGREARHVTPSDARSVRAHVSRHALGRAAPAPVIVPPGQLEGVRRLASAAAAGRVRMGPSLVGWTVDAAPDIALLAAPDPLRVSPIDIEPIAN
jgi:hypothetical protein